VNSFFYARFPRLGWFLGVYEMAPGTLIAVVMFGYFYSFSTESIATALLSLNRLTAIGLPLRHDRVSRV
jgi:hypothetical protein